ncbi:MAG: hypothetical protein WD872_17065 [Pirellulaceae bacterium]
MAAETSSHPERPEDEPLDAQVYDVHPALATPANYPYGQPVSATEPGSPFQVRPEDVVRPPAAFRFEIQAPKPAEYVVPQRFGLAAILGITTALAVLFGCLRGLNAEPGWYLFFGTQTLIICLVQMFHGKTPRQASAVAGAVIAPLFALGTAWANSNSFHTGGAVACMMIACVPLGAFLGYLNGTCAAGIFLIMDKLDPYLQGQRPIAAPAGPSHPLHAP